jgi:hypothetical protein
MLPIQTPSYLDTAIFTHPLVILAIGGLFGLFGYFVRTVVGLIKDTSSQGKAISDIAEILKHLTERQDKTDDVLAEIKNDLSELIGEHKAIARAGNLIGIHQKKS